MKKVSVFAGLILLAAGLLVFFTSTVAPPIIEQADTFVVVTRSDGTTIRSKPFRGEIVIGPDDYSTLEAISKQDGLSATFIQCDATLIDGKLEQTRCYRGFDHEDLNMIDVDGSIVIPEGGDMIDNESSASDNFAQISCSALVTDGRIKSTSCYRMDYPKGEFPVAPR
jgi:hypothetical protein